MAKKGGVIIKATKYLIILLFLVLSFVTLFYISQYSYLIPHTLFELLSALTAITIFSIGWNTRKISKNNFFIFLSIGYLIVGVLTVFHTLSYKGMNVFPEKNHDYASQFWITTRYIEALTLLMSTFFICNIKKLNHYLVLSLFTIMGAIAVISIFVDVFPICFTEEDGLTPFKIYSEYIICGILVLSGYRIWTKRSKLHGEIVYPILLSIFITILSELSFTLYSDVYGFFNFLGHYLMILSVLILYSTLVRGTLKHPYKILFDDVVRFTEKLSIKEKELSLKDKAIDASLNAFALISLDGIITYVNKSFLKLLGYNEGQEIIGKPSWRFFEKSKRIEVVKEIKRSNGKWLGEVVVQKKNGQLLDVYMTVNIVYSKENAPECVMASFVDISNLKDIQLELIQAKKTAEEASEAKSDFLASMSHEIRTPMNGILGFIHLLEKTSINSKQQSYIDNIKSSTDTLLTIINDIIDVSKIEANKLELENISFNLYQTLKEVVALYQVKAQEKDLLLKLKIDDNVPQFVKGDPVRLKQVLSNLINNSIKFTHKGYVFISVKKDESSQIQFSVEDTGIGMTKEEIDKIFDRFEQAHESTTRKFGGSGLGLTICRSLIKLMGGQISVDSKKNAGTTFSFWLPLEEDNKNYFILDTGKKENDYFIVSSYKDLKILLVEDNDVNRTLFDALLSLYNMKCDVAVNGEEAVESCLKKQYDIVFMDCQMPVLNGYQATKKIRHQEKIQPYIIAMTANAMKGDEERCIEAGMDDYLSKPINIKEFNHILMKYLENINKKIK